MSEPSKGKPQLRMASMTSNGKRAAALIGIVIAFALPKHTPCGVADIACKAHEGQFHRMCTPYELEPMGFFAIEYLVGRNVGFAYVSGEECE
ncbi:MAG TPA: hypothetical protein VGM88_03220 [Kofleriaceae bacterium]